MLDPVISAYCVLTNVTLTLWGRQLLMKLNQWDLVMD